MSATSPIPGTHSTAVLQASVRLLLNGNSTSPEKDKVKTFKPILELIREMY